jgi:hypothetical protein
LGGELAQFSLKLYHELSASLTAADLTGLQPGRNERPVDLRQFAYAFSVIAGAPGWADNRPLFLSRADCLPFMVKLP